MGSPGAAPRHVPALKQLVGCAGERPRHRRARRRHRRRVPRAARTRGRRSRRRRCSRAASACSISPARSACATRSCASAGIRRRSSSRPSVVYGLTERNRDLLRDSTLVACAGCYPTAAILALQPLLAGGLSIGQPIIIDAKSGVSGAGKTPTERTHFSECHGSLSAYGVFNHRHAAEIEQELGTPVTFVPHLLPIDRGILETIYARAAARRGRGGDRRGAARRLRRLAVRAAHRRRPPGDQARRAHELLRHRLEGEPGDAAAGAGRRASTTW